MNYISDKDGNPTDTQRIKTLCGSIAELEIQNDNGVRCRMGFRCTECFAVIGSVGMPTFCKELYAMDAVIRKLKGQK
jgi:hypothetical protein